MPAGNTNPSHVFREPALLVRAVINPARRDDAMSVLLKLGITAASTWDAVGIDTGKRGGHIFSKWCVIEFPLPHGQKDEALLALSSTVRTGRKNNDGKLFLLKIK